MRRRLSLLALPFAAIYAPSLAPTALASHLAAGGCQIKAEATISPGLTVTSETFGYRYQGKLSDCVYTGSDAGDSGTISAGEALRIHGQLYQEPTPAGTGGCLADQTTGYDFARCLTAPRQSCRSPLREAPAARIYSERPYGNLWFDDNGSTEAIGQITPAGQISEFSTGLRHGSLPWQINPGPDGNLWFTDENTPGIGRIGTGAPPPTLRTCRITM